MPKHGDTDQSAGVKDHLIDRLGGGFFGCHDEIAFVFSVFIVGHDDDAPGSDVANRFGD